MGLSTFVGVPDWRSALLAIALAVPWVFWFGRGWLRRPWLWFSLALGAALFAPSLAWLQVNMQQGLTAFWTRQLDGPTLQRYVPLLAIPSLLVASAVQESAKLLPTILSLRATGLARGRNPGLAFGAAAGAGFGGFEAFWVFNQIFVAGWSFAMFELYGAAALLGFAERFFAVMFHIGSAALLGYGYASGRPWRFWLLAVALHTISNYSVVLGQVGVLNVLGLEAWVAMVSLVTIGLAIWLRRRIASERVPAAVS